MKKTTVGFAMTGSFCTFDAVLAQMRELVRRDYDVIPILSYHAAQLDTRFMEAAHLHRELKSITGRDAIQTLQQAEPIGPEKMTDIYLLAPATGNTIAKLVNGIFDTPALLGAKSHLRNDRPLVVAVSTNDALSSAAQNIGRLLTWRNVYMVPYRQDHALKKPRSLVADFTLIPKTIQSALCGVQLQPIVCAPEGLR
ncbi:MAG: dipicolinate synthase subunit B [Clostridia bacterium]|nr:dipicolinate synthase subunit B [Clostridia bacterium]